MNNPVAYTPDQVGSILQLNTNTVYELIAKGEILAKKIGKVYRIPASSLSFLFTGLDADLWQLEQVDLKNQPKVDQALAKARAKLRSKT